MNPKTNQHHGRTKTHCHRQRKNTTVRIHSDANALKDRKTPWQPMYDIDKLAALQYPAQPHHPLQRSWGLWVHHSFNGNWDLESYVLIGEAHSIETLCTLMVLGLGQEDQAFPPKTYFFFMEKGVEPRFETQGNGGRWTWFVSRLDSAEHDFRLLVYALAGETMCGAANITGVNYSTKRNGAAQLRVWTKPFPDDTTGDPPENTTKPNQSVFTTCKDAYFCAWEVSAAASATAHNGHQSTSSSLRPTAPTANSNRKATPTGTHAPWAPTKPCAKTKQSQSSNQPKPQLAIGLPQQLSTRAVAIDHRAPSQSQTQDTGDTKGAPINGQLLTDCATIQQQAAQRKPPNAWTTRPNLPRSTASVSRLRDQPKRVSQPPSTTHTSPTPNTPADSVQGHKSHTRMASSQKKRATKRGPRRRRGGRKKR